MDEVALGIADMQNETETSTCAVERELVWLMNEQKQRRI